MMGYDFPNETVQTAFQKYTLETTNHIQYICQMCLNSLWKQPDKQPVIPTKAIHEILSKSNDIYIYGKQHMALYFETYGNFLQFQLVIIIYQNFQLVIIIYRKELTFLHCHHWLDITIFKHTTEISSIYITYN